MCIKSYKVSSSFTSQTTALNPSAQEWRPNSHTQTPPRQPHQLLSRVIITPHSQPSAAAPSPQTEVPVAAPCQPFQPPFYLSSYQGFTLYGPCIQPHPVYHSSTLGFSPPYGCPYAAATPVSGGGAEVYAKEKKLKSPTIKSPKSEPVDDGRKSIPPRLRRAMWSLNVEKKLTRRQEWRPKKSYSGNIQDAGAGSAASSPPLPSPRKPPSAAPPAKEFSPSLKTTVMIKNIPNQLRRDYMLEFLDMYCKAYSLEYDFIYLPMDFRKMDNLGYAFVNFTSADAAQKFKEILQNYKWNTVKTERGSFTSKKICEITWARIQGKEALVKRFQNSIFACHRVDFLPVVLDPPRNGSDHNSAPPSILGRLHKRVFSKIY